MNPLLLDKLTIVDYHSNFKSNSPSDNKSFFNFTVSTKTYFDQSPNNPDRTMITPPQSENTKPRRYSFKINLDKIVLSRANSEDIFTYANEAVFLSTFLSTVCMEPVILIKKKFPKIIYKTTSGEEISRLLPLQYYLEPFYLVDFLADKPYQLKHVELAILPALMTTYNFQTDDIYCIGLIKNIHKCLADIYEIKEVPMDEWTIHKREDIQNRIISELNRNFITRTLNDFLLNRGLGSKPVCLIPYDTILNILKNPPETYGKDDEFYYYAIKKDAESAKGFVRYTVKFSEVYQKLKNPYNCLIDWKKEEAKIFTFNFPVNTTWFFVLTENGSVNNFSGFIDFISGYIRKYKDAGEI